MKQALFFALLSVCAAATDAQILSKQQLQIPQGAVTTPAQEPDTMAQCREQAEQGDTDAAFQVGMSALIGQGMEQDAKVAEQYFAKAQMTPAQMCLVAETYMETSLPGRIETATRWINSAAPSSCSFWTQVHWWGGNQLGPDKKKQAEMLRHVLTARDADFRDLAKIQLGDLLLEEKSMDATETEKAAWLGAAARFRLAAAEELIAEFYKKYPGETDDPEAELAWTRKAARYGMPESLIRLGQAAMTRDASDLSYQEGMALYALGVRQNVFSKIKFEQQTKQMEAAAKDELENGIAYWERVVKESGGLYSKNDPLRFAEPAAEQALAALATPENPDAELRLAYLYERQGKTANATQLYKEVWAHGPAELLYAQANEAEKSSQIAWALRFYTLAAEYGSRPACAAMARIDAEGIGKTKDTFEAYLWLLRSGSKDEKLLGAYKQAVNADKLSTISRTNAEWFIKYKNDWPEEAKSAQTLLDAEQEKRYLQLNTYSKPLPPIDVLKRKADAGDTDSAYQLASTLLWNYTQPKPKSIEYYATRGAKTVDQKIHIAEGYLRADELPEPVRRRYAEKWYKAAGGARGDFAIGKYYNGKSDGIVRTEDEKRAVFYWQRAASTTDERWARLARMELGYRVVKGWSSGSRAKDARWAHELAMEFMAKEFYQVAGEYSYGRSLTHNPQTYALLAERAASYNDGNAQRALAQAMIEGQWKHGDDADAYTWMKLVAVKQDSGADKQVELAEKNPQFKARLEARYARILKTRTTSGAYYTEDDPLRTATATELEPRAVSLDPEAQFRLGQWLETQATPATIERAIDLYRTLWSSSSVEVRLTVGRRMMNGSGGMTRDDVSAEFWLEDAAQRGSHEACADLATLYAEGRGAQADPLQAEVWRRLAAREAKPTGKLSAADERVVQAKIDAWLQNHKNWWK